MTEAVDCVFNLDWDERKKVSWARYGSASAARSITGAWSTLIPETNSSAHLYACDTTRIHEADYWDLRVIVAINRVQPKKIPSTEGMYFSRSSSPFYESWIRSTHRNFERAIQAIQNNDFSTLASVAESSCLQMHALMLSTSPSLRYWNGVTVDCIEAIERVKARNKSVFYTIDAGSQVKVVCFPDVASEVEKTLSEVPGVQQVIQSSIGSGAYTY